MSTFRILNRSNSHLTLVIGGVKRSLPVNASIGNIQENFITDEIKFKAKHRTIALITEDGPSPEEIKETKRIKKQAERDKRENLKREEIEKNK